MRILVTGNLGYIGPVVTARLKAQFGPTAQVVGLDRGFFAGGTLDPYDQPETNVDVQYYGDVRDDNVCRQALEGAQGVIHLAAISNDPMGNQFESVTMEINRDRTIAIAKMARDAGVASFAFASSCSVYGAGGDAMRTESSPLDPLTAYARSKAEAEAGLSRLAGPGFHVSCLRFATACGASPRLRLDLVLNDFVASAVASRRIEILSNGQPWRPLIAVPDMARAMVWAVQRPTLDPATPLRVLNVGSNRWNYRVIELAHAIQAVLAGTHVGVNEAAAPDKRSYRVNFDAFHAVAPEEYHPKEELLGVVTSLAAQLRDTKGLTADFRHGPWIRLNVLRHLLDTGRLTATLERTGAERWI